MLLVVKHYITLTLLFGQAIRYVMKHSAKDTNVNDLLAVQIPLQFLSDNTV